MTTTPSTVDIGLCTTNDESHHVWEDIHEQMIGAIAVIWLLFTAGVYVPDVGRGFIKDDFRWVLDGAAALDHPAGVFVSGWAGNFFRPLVALSFGLDHAAYGLWARGYGFTNLALYVGCVVAVYAVLRQFGISPVAAAGGAFAWAVNPTGLDMAVLWLSGRTSLLMTLFSCVAITLFLRGNRYWGTLFFAAALFSKEDALAVPLIVVGGRWWRGIPARTWRTDLALMTIVTAAYLTMRSQTHAITMTNAPDFYRLTWDPLVLTINGLHYLDRAGTSTAVLMVLTVIAYGAQPNWRHVKATGLVELACVWFIAGLIITIAVPVRSSLYAVFPSVAAATAYAAVLDCLRGGPQRPSGDRWLLAVYASVLFLIPVYGIRNDRWVEPARVSTRTMNVVSSLSDAIADTSTIVFDDEPVRFSNFATALGGVEAPALKLFTGRELHGYVAPPGVTISNLQPGSFALRLTHGQVSRE
jgi:hypothetical protein